MHNLTQICPYSIIKPYSMYANEYMHLTEWAYQWPGLEGDRNNSVMKQMRCRWIVDVSIVFARSWVGVFSCIGMHCILSQNIQWWHYEYICGLNATQNHTSVFIYIYLSMTLKGTGTVSESETHTIVMWNPNGMNLVGNQQPCKVMMVAWFYFFWCL